MLSFDNQNPYIGASNDFRDDRFSNQHLRRNNDRDFTKMVLPRLLKEEMLKEEKYDELEKGKSKALLTNVRCKCLSFLLICLQLYIL